MLKTLGAALLKDYIGLIKKEEKFFSISNDDKRSLFAKYHPHYPLVFVDYLLGATEGTFIKELKQSIDIVTRRSYPDPQNALVSALAKFISEDFGVHFDTLSYSFFFEKLPQRISLLSELFQDDSALSHALIDLVLQGTYQELSGSASRALSFLKEAPIVVIQSPVEMAPKLRVEVRKRLTEKFPFSFPEFQVNTQIIGGLRVFVAGKVIDHSWLSRIERILLFNV